MLRTCVAIIDSQSAKTALKGGQRGYDAGKRKGRKRHIAVDMEGNPLAAIVHSADIQNLLRLLCTFNTINTLFVDGGYTGSLIDWAKEMFGCTINVVKRSDLKGFQVVAKCLIVERTFAWLNWCRKR
jgi:transposase